MPARTVSVRAGDTNTTMPKKEYKKSAKSNVLSFYEGDIAATFLSQNFSAFVTHVADFGYTKREASALAKQTLSKISAQCLSNV